MAHVQKYTRSASGHLLAHYERRKNDKGEYVKFGNQDIDLSRTHMNYNLAPDHDQVEYLQERLNQVKCMNRADVNVLCDWVVTIPKDFQEDYPDKTKDFFKETYKFLSERYGEKNVVSAYVHMDESTPHMHFAFVPVVKAQKKGQEIEKVSAFKLIDKKELSRFHTDLQKHLESSLGCNCNVLNGATENGNRSITELKLEKLQKATNFYQRQKERREKEFNEVSVEVRQLKDERVHVNARIEEEQDLLKDIKEVLIPEAQETLKDINEVLIPEAQEELKDINEVQLPQAREGLISAQISAKEAQDEVDIIKKEKELLEGNVTELKEEITALKGEIKELKIEVSQWQNSLDILKNKVVSILNSAAETFKKIIKLHIKGLPEDRGIELTDETREKHNEKIDQLEAHPQIKEKSKGIIDAAAEEVKEYIRPRRRGR